MPVADSSFLVALFDHKDPRHVKTRDLMRQAEHVLIGTETLVETLGVIKSSIGRRAAKEVLEGLMRLEKVGWEENCDLMAAYRLYHQKKTGSIVDALVIDLCLRLDTTPLTYDDKQARIVQEMQG